IREPVPEALGIINWSAQVQAAVADGAMDGDLDYWQQVVARGKQIVADQSHLFADEKAPRDTAVQTLPQRETRTLLRRSAALLRMTPQEMVLAAFIRSWQASLGHVGCVLSLEGHGRETFAGLGDCSSTLGWFTSLYPFVFAGEELPQIDLYRTVKDSIRCLPNKGFTYLPLRYYKGDDLRQTLTLRPQVSFNYLGESVADQAEWLMPTNEPAGDDHGDAVVEPFKLDVLARVIDGRLELTLRGQNPRQSLGLAELSAAWLAELGTLASRLQDLSSSAAGDGNAPQCLLSLSDSLVAFASLAELDETLVALQLPVAGIEEILPLTGMQQGMWLHCATHPTAYQDQVALRLQQPVDEQRFAAAVRALVAETQALRTGFAQKANGELLQIVFYERSGYYQYLDDVVGAGVYSNQREETLVRLRASLRSKPRDLLRDPLFSLTLVCIDQSCFELIIDFHHMAIDGWTSALLLQRLEALYFADARGGDVNAASGMRTYFQWLGQQSPARAREYWQQLLGDYQSRSDVPAHLPRLPATEPTPLFVETRAGQALHARLLSWCEQHGLTLNAVVQTLWGVYLGRLTGSDDLVFGATVSGRDIELAGVGTIAGMLINTLPVRIQTTNAATFAEQVRETAQQFADSMSFGHLTLAEIQTLTPARAGLVTHALVFENYPAPDAGAARWQWQAQEIFDPMHFEFGLIVAPLANDLSFRFVADGSVYLQERLETMGTDLCAMLSALLDGQQSLKALAQDNSAGWTVSANFTADSLVGLLQYHEHISGRSAAVTLLPYDQSVQELINPDSRLRRLRPQQHVVLWRPVTDEGGQVVATAAAGQLAELAAALAAYSQA
ncbi:MAG: condensation domain-containing protein, partial [Pseudohongiella sp.]